MTSRIRKAGYDESDQGARGYMWRFLGLRLPEECGQQPWVYHLEQLAQSRFRQEMPVRLRNENGRLV